MTIYRTPGVKGFNGYLYESWKFVKQNYFFQKYSQNQYKSQDKKKQNTHFIKFFHVNSADLYRHDVIIAHSC